MIIQKIYYFFFFKFRKLMNPTGNPTIDRFVKLSGHKVKIGAYSYGFEDTGVLSWNENIEISIGRFCSVASGLKLYCGGNHRVDWISTFPFGHIHTKFIKVPPVNGTPSTNGNITIGNDVWIGRDVTILSGITIGNGAVIASNSHIVKDVEPYSIVGGNPAKLIKKRFNESIINFLLDLSWWDLPIDVIEKIVPYLSMQITENQQENILQIKNVIISSKEIEFKNF
jgi:acetyltransferase-like isoleucine patch superfamily enzyme